MKKPIIYLFVESPLQLINAYEALATFNIKNFKLLVRLSNIKKNDEQIKYLVRYLKIENVKYVSIKVNDRKANDFFKMLLYKYFFLFKRIEQVFIGNIESGFMNLIVKQLNKKQIILLDDGAKTLSIQRSFTTDSYYNLFTMYNILPIGKQNIYKNSFKRVSSLIVDEVLTDKEIVLFLGMKLSELDIISEDYYLELMEKISDLYSDKQIIYISHRGESKAKLEKLNNINNIAIKVLDYPVELYGLYENILPYKVISFYSTALLTMKNIYKIEAESFMFDYANSEYKSAIHDTYTYYKKYIRIIDLNA